MMNMSLLRARLDELDELAREAPAMVPIARTRLYYDVLRAVADGSEVSALLARMALLAEGVESAPRTHPLVA